MILLFLSLNLGYNNNEINTKGYNFKSNDKKDINMENMNAKITVPMNVTTTTKTTKISTTQQAIEQDIKNKTTTQDYLSSVCIYTFTDFERSIFCKLASFKKTNPSCC